MSTDLGIWVDLKEQRPEDGRFITALKNDSLEEKTSYYFGWTNNSRDFEGTNKFCLYLPNQLPIELTAGYKQIVRWAYIGNDKLFWTDPAIEMPEQHKLTWVLVHGAHDKAALIYSRYSHQSGWKYYVNPEWLGEHPWVYKWATIPGSFKGID